MSSALLVVDAGGRVLTPLVDRLRHLGIPAVCAKTGAEARAALADPRWAIAAVAIPPDLPTLDLPRALAGLTRSADGRRALLVCGARPAPAACERLRQAGARLALFEPWDDHAIRFQVNRAFAGAAAEAPTRGALRVPVRWPVEVRSGRRGRPARVYAVSTQGAFLVMGRPSLRNSLVHVALPLAPEGGDPVRLAGQVVSTNVPGNLRRRNLPLGMGVRFLGVRPEATRVLERFTAERSRELVL